MQKPIVLSPNQNGQTTLSRPWGVRVRVGSGNTDPRRLCVRGGSNLMDPWFVVHGSVDPCIWRTGEGGRRGPLSLRIGCIAGSVGLTRQIWHSEFSKQVRMRCVDHSCSGGFVAAPMVGRMRGSWRGISMGFRAEAAGHGDESKHTGWAINSYFGLRGRTFIPIRLSGCPGVPKHRN